MHRFDPMLVTDLRKNFLSLFGARRNPQTPERPTIEKPLYFDPRKFMGQFTTAHGNLFEAKLPEYLSQLEMQA